MFCNLDWLHFALQDEIQGVQSKIKNCTKVVQRYLYYLEDRK